MDALVTTPVSIPVMAIDGPAPGALVSGAFVIGGWVADLGTTRGTGVDVIHVWGYPVGGASPFLVGTASYGGVRSDIGALYGAHFTNTGYGIVVPALAAGTYDFVVFAQSTVAGTFNQTRVVRVTVR